MLERFLIGMAIVVMVFFLLESLTYRAIWKAYGSQSWWSAARMFWWGGHGVLWASFLAAVVLWPSWRESHPVLLRAILSITFAVSIPKVFVAAVQLLDELRALGAWTWLKVSGQSTDGAMARGSFLNHVAQALGGLAFFGMAYGILRGKYAYKVRDLVVAHPNLPQAFDGLRVVQLSDAHLGSFEGTPEPVLKALEKVNELRPDVILFTGDLVNDWADEAEPWVESFAALDAPMGKFSIMGNHDYADYGSHDDEERMGSIAKLKSLQSQMGFQMLDNSHVLWEKEGDIVVLAGVENWGRGFRQSGNLSQALQGSDAQDRFTVLMSHDPTHFESMVMNEKAPVELTLSGHTHGMQLGIEIPWLGIKWSPSSLRYKRWGGLYLEGTQYLHVNRGFGVLGFPGRVGMPPEITVLTLVQGEARA